MSKDISVWQRQNVAAKVQLVADGRENFQQFGHVPKLSTSVRKFIFHVIDDLFSARLKIMQNKAQLFN